MADGGAAGISKEAFERMIKQIDVDGDGIVTKEEYTMVQMKMDPSTTQEYIDAEWNKLDADGDGNLTVEELATHYGFAWDADVTTEMTDEQILETLKMQAALEELNRAAPEPPPPPAAAKDKRDHTIRLVYLEESQKKKNKTEDDDKMVSMLEAIMLGDLEDKTDGDSLERAINAGVYVRVEDEKGEMPLHKLARLTRFTDEEHKGIFTKSFSIIITAMKAQVKKDKDEKATIQADVNHQDKQGKTPLLMAIEHKNALMIDLLFELGRDGPDSLLINKEGWTVLHVAVFADDLPLLKVLDKHFTAARIRLLLKTQDKMGREPLHIAAYKCTTDMVSYLLEKGATNDREDLAKHKPSALAALKDRRRSKELIEEKFPSCA